MQESDSKQAHYKCSFLDQCTFVQENQERMPELVQRIQQQFCADETAKCSRKWLYMILKPDQIPPLMLPNQFEWASQIVDEFKKDPDSAEQTASA